MSVNGGGEGNNGWGDLKSSDAQQERKDPWRERSDREGKKSAGENSDAAQHYGDAAGEKSGTEDPKKSKNRTEGEIIKSEAVNETSEGRTASRDESQNYEKKGFSEKESTKSQPGEVSWNDGDPQWGEAEDHGGAGYKSWNDSDKTGERRRNDQGKREFQQYRPRGYENPDQWQERRGQKRVYDSRNPTYDDTRKYGAQDYYPSRKRRVDDGYYGAPPPRFREGARHSPGSEMPRRQEWSGPARDEMREGWSGQRSNFERENFDARSNWSRAKPEGYSRVPRDDFSAPQSDWSRPRDNFAPRDDLPAPRENWSRAPRPDNYAPPAKREQRREDFEPWNAQPRGEFPEKPYNQGDVKRYRPYNEGRYPPATNPSFRPEFRRRREVPVNPPPSKVIGLFGLSSHATLDDVKEFLVEKIPDIRYENVHLVKDGYTGQSRGFGFVYFSSLDEAITAKELLQGQSIYSKAVRVDYSVSEGPRTMNNGNN